MPVAWLLIIRLFFTVACDLLKNTPPPSTVILPSYLEVVERSERSNLVPLPPVRVNPCNTAPEGSPDIYGYDKIYAVRQVLNENPLYKSLTSMRGSNPCRIFFFDYLTGML